MNAPCGHPGEVVVGTYVRCIRGCEGAAPPSKRGIEGHVRDCACASCKACHRVSWFATRTKAGDDSVKLYWGGKAESTGAALSMYLPDGKLRHLNAVDIDGQVLASHPIFFDARAGDKLDFTFDPATLSFSSVKHWGKSRLSDYVKLTISSDLPQWKDLYATLDHAPLYPEYIVGRSQIPREIPYSMAGVRAHALMFPGVDEVAVEEGNGVVHVKVLRGADNLSGSSMKDLENHLAADGPVGVRYRAHLMTPQNFLMREVKKAYSMAVSKIEMLGCDVEGTLKSACKEITRGLKNLRFTETDVVYDPSNRRVTAKLRTDHKVYYAAFQLRP